ncbi:SpvB/TcaC N-terminal domain-containing protein [Flavivirga jejuensis]|uniref:YD repeat-containing protein n=1 Tax=Flavivirga jejuensis TaxID=870487 RepID=A0ABT8WPD0_9FLAO|nr:hypothetical protein [Flavivirga jejuensis]MDO5975013.1 hypothetical protein [Flavivirga jejuensis]
MIKIAKKITSILFCVTLSQFSLAQTENIFPPSPEASALAEYAKIPVSLPTGVANINLPLMELKGKDMNIPVSLSYHSAGNKVNEMSSSVGLGWTLNAGGVITRVVRGRADETNGYLVGAGAILQNDFNTIPIHHFMLYDSDSEPDIYYFNFLGHTGRFVLGYQGDVIMTPEQDYKIIPPFGPKSVVGENYWTVYDKSGNIYKFGVTENEQEVTNNSTTGSLSDQNYRSAWYLSSIVTAKGEQFDFEYKQGANYTFRNVTEAYTYAYCSSTSTSNRYRIVEHITGVIKPLTLKKISSRFGSIEITSEADREDLTKSNRITKLQLLDHNETLIKTVELDNNAYFISKEDCASDECKRLKLLGVDEISRSGDRIRKYEFEYNTTPLPKRNSPEVDHWGYYNGNGETSLITRDQTSTLSVYSTHKENKTPNELYTKAGILEKITYQTGGYTKFIYGLNEFRAGMNNYQGGGLRIESIENYENANTPPIITNYKYTREGSLTESSGTTYGFPEYLDAYFHQEVTVNNNPYYVSDLSCYGYRVYSSSMNEIFDLNGANVTYGEAIIEYMDGSKQINKYTDLLTNGDEYSDRIFFRNIYTGYFDYSIVNDFELHSYTPLTPNVDLDSGNWFSQNTNPTDINTYFSAYQNNSGSPYAEGFTIPKLRNSYQRGLLLERKEKNADGKVVHQINNEYEVDSTNLKTTSAYVFSLKAVEWDVYGAVSPTSFKYDEILTYKANRYLETNKSYRLKQSKEATFETFSLYQTDEKIEVITDYTYSTIKPTLVKEQTTTHSNQDVKKISYTYPFDPSMPFFDEFTARNQINSYLEKTEYLNDVKLSKEEHLYDDKDPIGGGLTMLFPTQTNYQKKNSSSYNGVVIDHYDSNGNIIEYHNNDNVPISILWGYGNRYPIAKIVNATYAEVSNYVGDLQALRDGFPNAMVTTYSYAPLIGVTSITDPKGYTTYYEYDDFNRLKQVKDADGKILSHNEYHYKSQQ